VGKKPEIVSVGKAPIVPITVKERKKIAKQLAKEGKPLRNIFPEVHGKVVDFITHGISDGILYVSVRFTDETNFSLRYAAEMLVLGADLSDWKTGNMEMIQDYMKPLPR